MGFVNFVLAVSPIALVLVGIMTFKKPAMKVAPIALLWAMVLSFTYFNLGDLGFKETVAMLDGLVWKGIKEGLKIVVMVFGAFVILNILKATGAMEDVKNTVARVSGKDRRVQLTVIGFMMVIFLEGAAGAGAPAAIAAPFLVALGFDPITAAAIGLLGDATPCSWGGAGLTTINGGTALVEAGISTAALNSAMVGRIHMFGALIIPFINIFIASSKVWRTVSSSAFLTNSSSVAFSAEPPKRSRKTDGNAGRTTPRTMRLRHRVRYNSSFARVTAT